MAKSLDAVEYLPREHCPLHDAAPGGTADALRFWASVDDKITGRTFRVLRCTACGAGLTDPYPSAATVHRLYLGRESLSNFDPMRGTLMDRLKDFFARSDMRQAHVLGGSPRVVSVLDFGAGSGRFSLACKMVFAGCGVDAVDFDPDPPPHLRDVPGIRYLQHQEYLRESKRYDFILLRGVLEHIHDPIALLRLLAQRLSPRGILYMEVPNIDSAYIHYFGKNCNGYAVPYHLFNFDRASFRSVIQRAGLTSTIFFKGLPLAGCVLAATLGQQRNLVHQLAGIALHPVQLLLEWQKGKYVLAALCKPA